jgi:hypothetical protein
VCPNHFKGVWRNRQCSRYLTAKGKCRQEVVTAVSRELLGFIWAIGVKVEGATRQPRRRPIATRHRTGTRRIGGGRGAHGQENPRELLCGGLPGSTRAFSPRQLPTDHDYAVSTREYQADQPSRFASRPPPMRRRSRTRACAGPAVSTCPVVKGASED